jgi:NADH:ubiquinone oxidoreductase subunit E
MGLSEEQKEIKKELAGYKRKITETAGVIHDIVEDTIWVDYDKLPQLSEQIQVQMQQMLEFKSKYDFLK